MKYMSLIILLFFSSVLFSQSSLQNAKKEGKSFGKKEAQASLKQVQTFTAEDLKPLGSTNEKFNSEKARVLVENQSIPPSEAIEFLNREDVWKNSRDRTHLLDDEYFLNHADEIADHSSKNNNQIIHNEIEYELKTAIEGGEPYHCHSNRKLKVSLHHQPGEKKIVNVCLGHKSTTKHFWKEDAEDAADKMKLAFAVDPLIKTYQVTIEGGKGLSKYTVKSCWTHIDDSSSCQLFSQTETKISNETWEESDDWELENPQDQQWMNSPLCTLISKDCIEADSSKVIGGKEIYRKCWLEKLSYLCRHEDSGRNSFAKNNSCNLLQKKCVKESELGCALWELTYQCVKKINRRVKTLDGDIYGLQEDENDLAYEHNTSFSHVYTTLNVFEEIKKELEVSESADATKVQIFKGKKFQCSKSIASDLMYDCCFSYKGLAEQLKLSQCTADEIALADIRERGLCHYLGSYEEEFLKLWTSRTEHVFCCFPSKISRVFQEEARKHLGISWGTPEKPNCRGLTSNELSSLDFTRMDLAEAFEQMPNAPSLEDKFKSLESKLKQRLAEVDRDERD